MTGAPAADADPLALRALLEAREARAGRQAALLERHGTPLVCLTIVTPGPVKDSRWTRRALREGVAEFAALGARRRWPVLAQEHLVTPGGPEAIYAVAADGAALKTAVMDLEETHPIGRLWDFDVIGPGMTVLSRRAFGRPPRPCLLCGRPARECGRAQRHPLDRLSAAIEAILEGPGAGARA